MNYRAGTYWWTPSTSQSLAASRGMVSCSSVPGHISIRRHSNDQPTCVRSITTSHKRQFNNNTISNWRKIPSCWLKRKPSSLNLFVYVTCFILHMNQTGLWWVFSGIQSQDITNLLDLCITWEYIINRKCLWLYFLFPLASSFRHATFLFFYVYCWNCLWTYSILVPGPSVRT